MPEILLATHNAGKLRELQALTVDTPLVWRTLLEFPDLPEAEEYGATFADNARIKALFYATRTGLPTLADDSGLEVDALGGAPGVHSARYAGRQRDDAANNRKLVAALATVPLPLRTARFRCAMAFVEGTAVVLETTGTFEGLIVDTPRGTHGFGYDPHFFVPETGCTSAELPPAEKNTRSHRGAALRTMLGELAALYRARGTWP